MHRVIYNQGDQTIRFVPYEDGRPLILGAAPTYAIEDLTVSDTSSERTVASGTATQQGATTTTTVAAGPAQSDDSAMTVASAASFVDGHAYTISLGQNRELFRLQGVSGSVLYSETGLREDYAIGAAVQDAEWECTFPSSEANDEDNLKREYQVKWTYTANGVKYVIGQPIEMVRYAFPAVITEADVYMVNDSLDARCRNSSRIPDAIRAAMKHYEARIRQARRDPSEFRGSPVMELAVAYKAAAIALRNFKTEDDRALAADYDSEWDSMCNSELNGEATHGTKEIDRGSDMDRKPTYGSEIISLS